MVQGPGQAKGSAVEVAAPDVKGEEKLAGEDQLTAPTGQGVPTNSQYILHTKMDMNVPSIDSFVCLV